MPRADPASKLIVFNVLVPLVGVAVFVGEMSIPCTATPAAVLVLLSASD